jgi:hypothetical protein
VRRRHWSDGRCVIIRPDVPGHLDPGDLILGGTEDERSGLRAAIDALDAEMPWPEWIAPRGAAMTESPVGGMPPWIDRLFRIECPACGRRWWRSMWNPLAYSMHYASEHLGIRIWRDLHG